MKIAEHQESFEEHKETIFRWALEVKGIDKSQRIIGLHASRAILDLLSIYLLKKGKMSPGKQINHRWFKSGKVSDKLPDFKQRNSTNSLNGGVSSAQKPTSDGVIPSIKNHWLIINSASMPPISDGWFLTVSSFLQLVCIAWPFWLNPFPAVLFNQFVSLDWPPSSCFILARIQIIKIP